MKKLYIAAALMLVVLGSILLWRTGGHKPYTPAPASVPSEAVPDQTHPPRSATPAPSERRQSGTAPSPQASDEPAVSDAVREYVRKSIADPAYDWKQSINFYGKVVDETSKPVAGASVDYTWSTLAANGTLTKHGESDASGLFSIHETGKRIGITISKEGYYTTPSEKLRTYEYANPADGLFTPDPNSPVVFHLRRKGIGANLITSQYGVKNYLGVTGPLDGTPVRVDLLARKSGGQDGSLILSQTKPAYQDWKQATAWSFRMEIPDGGFVEENDEFPFEAPESGYQSLILFEFQNGQTNWTTSLSKDFYVKFGEPPRYGRLHLETLIEMAGARLTYAINPDGSRYLEPK